LGYNLKAATDGLLRALLTGSTGPAP
jgi:hypothetical protein